MVWSEEERALWLAVLLAPYTVETTRQARRLVRASVRYLRAVTR